MEHLVNELSKLPTIGPKTAQRLAFFILKTPMEEVEKLADALLEVKKKVRHCNRCFSITEQEVCEICQDTARDRGMVCVLERPSDVSAIERSGGYRGLYHVLLGSISPLDGIGPDDLKIKELMGRLRTDKIREVILATNLTVEGEATALYLLKQIKPLGIKVTRIAYGIPAGGDLEYADEVTLGKALEGRREM
jgi:recombination protein RecR